MMNEMLKAALEYHDMGYSVIPVLSTKKPLIKWKEYQNKQTTKEEIISWWTQNPTAMIGLITGCNTGLFVIDCDTEEAYHHVQEYIPESMVLPVAKSPNGWHLYFKMPDDNTITIGANCMPGVDFRGNGGFIVAPPSKNMHGELYQWLTGAKLDGAPPRVPSSVLINIIKNNNILDMGVVRGGNLCSKDVVILKKRT